jgi:hypothetical protein
MKPYKRRGARFVTRASLCWLVLVAFCANLVPLPMGTRIQSESAGEQYPCQASLCGCKSAVQCWTSCCCHTPAERLAWAAKHNVTPPAYFANVLRMEKLNKASSQKQCCLVGHSKQKQPAIAKLETRKTRLVIGILSAKCQGKSSLFTAIPWATLATKFVLPYAVVPNSSFATPRSPSLHDVLDRPPTPPPRINPVG